MYWQTHNIIVKLIVSALELSGFLPYEAHPSISSRISVDNKLIDYMILVEDRNFMRHNGVDLLGVGRAIIRRISKGTIEGASTIEQQYTRTLSGRYERTINRKLSEWVSSYHLNKRYDKREIALMYLEIAYFGAYMNGISQACSSLSINPIKLTDQEAAIVIAHLKYPRPKHPSPQHLSRHQARVNHILQLSRGTK